MNYGRKNQKTTTTASLGRNRQGLVIVALIMIVWLACCTVAVATSAEQQEKKLLRHAGSVCLKAGDGLMKKMTDHQRDAFFSPLVRSPGIRVEHFPIAVGEPTKNPREWNAYVTFTVQGHVCMVLTTEMVKSLYQLAKIQATVHQEQSESFIDDLASRVARGGDLGRLSEGLESSPLQKVDVACTCLASGLIAHEFAHIYLGHLGTALRARGLSPNSSLQEINTQLKKLAYRRAQETEADIAGLDHAIRVHPNCAVGMLYTYDFMSRIDEKRGKNPLPTVLLSHPHAKERVAYLLNRLERIHRMNVAAMFPDWFLKKYKYQPGQR